MTVSGHSQKHLVGCATPSPLTPLPRLGEGNRTLLSFSRPEMPSLYFVVLNKNPYVGSSTCWKNEINRVPNPHCRFERPVQNAKQSKESHWYLRSPLGIRD